RTPLRNFVAKKCAIPIWIFKSITARRNSGEFLSRARASASDKYFVAPSAAASSHCATSSGEYFPLRALLTTSAAYSLIVEKSCGSSGLTLPNTLGDGVSEYGEGFEAPTID